MPLSRVVPAHYQPLLDEKVASVSSLLEAFAAPAPQVFPSQPTGFRLRAEFRIWHEGDDLNYVMFRPQDPKIPIAIHDFPIADYRIQRLMPVLREKLKNQEALRHKLFQVEFLVTLAGDTLVSLIYHRKLEQAWEAAATTLAQDLDISIVGRSRKQKLVIGRDFVQEVLLVNGNKYSYRQYEQAFTQPNGKLNIRMIEWACNRTRELDGDLLELYCGNGNFTLPLSRQFDHVIATELSKASIRAARENLLQNNIDNIHMIRLSAEEVTQAMGGIREFRRLAELPRPLGQYDLRTIFVDPPRAGLDEHTLRMAATFESIIYVSCNPQTLAQNLQTLCKTHHMAHVALFDQFPYTDHMECGVFLRRKPL
ncbi:MAG: tRNA (uridine(54)-C5)-methyltransferase TrmA [Gammaproteobacteria bacterium]|nr:MAG: tRNA (uridine(54)-C5)-methyltransferase TrmA [Gammaproteobacteria bacterium]